MTRGYPKVNPSCKAKSQQPFEEGQHDMAMFIAFKYLWQRKVRALFTSFAVMLGVAVIYAANTVVPAMQTALENAAFGEDGSTLTVIQGFSSEAAPIDETALNVVRAIEVVQSAELTTLNMDGSAVPALRVRLVPGTSANMIDQSLREVLIDYQLESGSDLFNISLQNTFLQIAFNVFGVLALAVGAMLIFITFQTLVLQRQRDIGTLRLVGAARQQVAKVIFAEGLILGVFGGLFGVLAGQLLTVVMFNLLWRLLYDRFQMPESPFFNVHALLIGVMVGIGVTLIASYIPAHRAGRSSPMQAFRSELPQETRKGSRLRFIFGVLLVALATALVLLNSSQAGIAFPLLLVGAIVLMPFILLPLNRLLLPIVRRIFPHTADFILGGLVRQPWRTSATANLMLVGLAVVIGIVTLLTPFNIRQEQMIRNQVPDSDIELSGSGITSEVIEQVRATPNVARIYETWLGHAIHEGEAIPILAVDPEATVRVRFYSLVIETDDRFLTLNDAVEQIPYLQELSQERTAFVSQLLSERLQVHTGDTLLLQGKNGMHSYQILGVSDEDWMMPDGTNGVIVMSQANARQDFNINGWFEISIELRDTAQADATYEAVSRLMPQDSVYNRVTARQQMIQDNQRGSAIFYVMGALVIVPAILGLLNTILLNVHERTREISMLRSIGMESRQVRQMVIGEAVLLTTMSAIIAAVIGLIGGAGMFQVLNSQPGTPTTNFTLPFPEIAGVILLALLIVATISLIPASRAASLKIVQNIQHE